MNIAIKLGSLEELELLSYYKGPFKYYELPAKMLTEQSLIKELLSNGFKFNIHGITMHTDKTTVLAVEGSCHYLRLCKETGCLNFILHGLVIEDFTQANNAELLSLVTKTLNTINKYALKLGIECFLENGCYIRSDSKQFLEIPSRPSSHLKIARELGTCVVLDLGHAAVSAKWYGETLNDFLLPYAQNTKPPDIIHFSDNFQESDEHLAIGDGAADTRDFYRAIELWPNALMTVENYPDRIHKTLNWLIEHERSAYRKSDVEDLCTVMGWAFEKATSNESRR